MVQAIRGIQFTGTMPIFAGKKQPAQQLIGYDIGGTSIKGANVQQGKPLNEKRYPTPRSFQEFVNTIVEDLKTRYNPKSKAPLVVGISCAGTWDPKTGKMLGGYGNIPALKDNPFLQDALKQKMGSIPATFYILNDANAAAYAETKVGAAKETNDSILIILGTGVGAGIVRDGKLLQGANNIAGEAGHIPISLSPDRDCSLHGAAGCWESYAAGPGLLKTAQKMLQEQPAAARKSSLLANGRTIETLSTYDIVNAWKKNDPFAKAIKETWHKHIATGLSGVIALEDPKTIVLGGGMAPFVDLRILNRMLKQHLGKLLPADSATPVVKAKLGNTAGMVGAALLAQENQAK